jgi:hypothetical protein
MRRWLNLLDTRTFGALFAGAVVLVSFEPFHGAAVTLAAAVLVAAAYYAVFRERG